MTPTSEERQTIAEKLRESVQEGKYLDQSIGRAILSTMNSDEVYNLPIGSILADLIDPTCHMVDTDHEYEDSIRCGVCQMTFNRPWEPFKFCPNCGARVVSSNDTD